MELGLIQNKIFEIRGHKVMLDFDLAVLYETETKRLKEAVKRNANRFPSDFMFEITREEYNFLRTQFATLEKGKGRYSKYLPYAFTEQGVAMLSTVLKSNKAIEVNIAVMRAFVFMRQYALTHKDLTEKLNELEKTYNKQFADVYEALNYLINKDNQEEKPKTTKRIGYMHYD
jgi:hypothetical protein